MERHDDAADADRLEQRRELMEEPRDVEATTSPPSPDQIEADPADVLDQAIEVPDDEEDERSEW